MGMTTNWGRCIAALLVATIALGTSVSSTFAADEKAKPQAEVPKIQMAILLDTSGSMRGLLNQARGQLWKVVNEFADAKRGDQRPLLEVALYEYGHDSLGAENGFMRQIVPLTDDLDKISEELFKLATGGSAEFCGQVIGQATSELKWSNKAGDLKCIFIAGNEGFAQGPVDFRKACGTAANKGITVSTIFCGPNAQGVSLAWLEASKLADGSYMSINQNRQQVAINAPQDKQLIVLNSAINKTYVAYGNAKDRKKAADRQLKQDSNAADSGPAAGASRAKFKSSRLYNNARWDLCDAYRLGKIKIEDLKPDQLPENLRKMTLKQRKAYIDKMIKERQGIQKQIKELSDARSKYVAVELKKQSVNTDDSLDAAIIQSVRKQAETKNFKFEK